MKMIESILDLNCDAIHSNNNFYYYQTYLKYETELLITYSKVVITIYYHITDGFMLFMRFF